jgi:hypothetical protein
MLLPMLRYAVIEVLVEIGLIALHGRFRNAFHCCEVGIWGGREKSKNFELLLRSFSGPRRVLLHVQRMTSFHLTLASHWHFDG